MSKHAIHLEIRASDGFGSDADQQDPRTPEQRAARQSAWLAGEAWSRLRWAAPVNLSLIGLLLASVEAGTAMLPSLLLGLACALALVAVAPRPPGEREQRWIMAVEGVASAAAVVWAAALVNGPGVLLAAVALAISPCARAGIAAWIHLALLASAAAVMSAATQPWMMAATLMLAVVTAAQIQRHSRHTMLRATQRMELEELNALCTRLVAEPGTPEPNDQDLP